MRYVSIPALFLFALSAQADIYALKDIQRVEAPVTTKVAKTPTVVLRKTIALEAGDWLSIRTAKQFTEDKLTNTRVTAYVRVNGKTLGGVVSQLASRGKGANHHMPLSISTGYTAPAAGTYTVELVAENSSSASVTVDAVNYGGMNIEIYRKYADADAAIADNAYFLKDMYASPSGGSGYTLVGVNKGFVKYSVARLSIPVSKDDWVSYNSQGVYRFRTGGSLAEMVVSRLEAVNSGGKTLDATYIGENVTSKLTYLTHAHVNSFKYPENTTGILNFLTYGGNGTGFYYSEPASYLQALHFSPYQSRSRALVSKNYTGDTMNRSMGDYAKSTAQVVKVKSQPVELSAGGILRISSGTQITNATTTSAVCYLKVVIYEKNGNTLVVAGDSQYAMRTINPANKSAALAQTFLFTVKKAAQYQAETLAFCRGTKYTTTRTGTYVLAEGFDEI